MFAKCPLVLLNLISVVLVKVSQAQQLQQNFSVAQMLALQNISNICNLGEFPQSPPPSSTLPSQSQFRPAGKRKPPPGPPPTSHKGGSSQGWGATGRQRWRLRQCTSWHSSSHSFAARMSSVGRDSNRAAGL